MNFQALYKFFNYSKEQRKALILLLVLIFCAQAAVFFMDFNTDGIDSEEKQQWLSLQVEIDSLKNAKEKAEYKRYPFNPNFITDYKGYTLGMSVKEIDRLHAYRKQNKYVNSAEEFQKLTKVSDSLLSTMVTFFKFPDWVKNRKSKATYVNYKENNRNKKAIVKRDINYATAEQLIEVYGVGGAFSKRILNYRSKIGAFVSMEQITEVWGLSDDAVQGIKEHFKVGEQTAVNKLAINNASIKDISKFPYFNYKLSRSIVIYRSMNGDFKKIEDLLEIKGFPVDKAKIIALYLDFN
ncbi:helix-hairpin-helix domain-containing protein [Flavobacterium sp. 14A]|uniref:ComEA family DNA-binding protein n=1 Tax=Flavobacterium sp. 14A TaxID=2735896 RepID=UPI00156FF101|nr:helix-hairpin-helix domain-containing protein [Flavobacterium sp. 14A]NRT11401.1 DNA uptake protein ComE-like DNA-binding protein [Flavobacterium sp. 14A]